MFNLIYKWTDKIKAKVAELSKKLGEKGQGLTEYALILAAIAVIAVISVYNAGGIKEKISQAFTNAGTNIDAANTATGGTGSGGTGTGTGTGTGGGGGT